MKKLILLLLLVSSLCFGQTAGGAGADNTWTFPGDVTIEGSLSLSDGLTVGGVNAQYISEGNGGVSTIFGANVVGSFTEGIASAGTNLERAGAFASPAKIGDVVIIQSGTDDTNYGIYIIQAIVSNNNATLDRALAGTDTDYGFSILADGVVIENFANSPQARLILPPGTVSRPSLAWWHGRLGFYAQDSNTLQFISDGNAIWEFNQQYIHSTTAGGAAIRKATSSASLPAFTFDFDLNTGVFRLSEDVLGFSAGGVVGMRIAEVGGIAAMHLPEIDTPTPIPTFGSIYPKSDNKLYFQDGAGVEHALLVASQKAFSSLWYYNGEVATIISTQNEFAQIVNFENTGEEDANANVVGDPTTNNDLVIGANGGGVYQLAVQSSFRNAGGGSIDFLIVSGITLASPKAIASSTFATPIEVTTTLAHGLKNGDMVRISNHLVNTNLNVDSRITKTGTNTFTVVNLSGTNIAGNGTGGSTGNIDVVFPGNILIERIVSNTSLGRGMGAGTYSLSVSDIIEMYVADLDGTSDYIAVQNTLSARRID